MYAAIRSPLVAGVTLIGAGAIAVAVSPIAPAPTDVHLPAVRLAAAVMQDPPVLENPIDVWAPVFQQTLADVQALITQQIRDPAPILQAALLNQVNDTFALVGGVGQAGVVLGDAAFNAPAAFRKAAEEVRAGDPQGALTTLEEATLLPLLKANSIVVGTVQSVNESQLAVEQRLAVAVPEAAAGVTRATFNAFDLTTRAAIDAHADVVKAVQSGDPINVANAIIEGGARVALVAEQTTIGQPKFAEYTAESADVSLAKSPSIAVAVANGRRQIANAYRPEVRFVSAQQSSAITTTAALAGANKAPAGNQSVAKATKTTGPVRSAIKSVAKSAKQALGVAKEPAAAASAAAAAAK